MPTAPLSHRKALVGRYFDGFRSGDQAAILKLLTDDVVWDLPGSKRLTGKEAFASEIKNEAFVGKPRLLVDRLVEEGDTIVALGTGEAQLATGPSFRFAYCTVFTFSGDLIRRVESHVVPLN